MSNTDPDKEVNAGNGKWGEADKRLLLITFLGGLGANIGLAFVVGLVIALIRLKSEHDTTHIVLLLAIYLLLGMMLGGSVIFFHQKLSSGNLGFREILAILFGSCASVPTLRLCGTSIQIKAS